MDARPPDARWIGNTYSLNVYSMELESLLSKKFEQFRGSEITNRGAIIGGIKYSLSLGGEHAGQYDRMEDDVTPIWSGQDYEADSHSAWAADPNSHNDGT